MANDHVTINMSPKNFALFLALESDGDDPAPVLAAIKAGGNPNYQDPTIITPLIGAINANKPRMVDALLAHGANPDLADAVSGNHPLAFAAYKGISVEIAESLIRAGADVLWSLPGEPAPEGSLLRFAAHNKRDDYIKAVKEAQRARRRLLNRPPEAAAEIVEAIELPPPPRAPMDADETEALASRLDGSRLTDIARALEDVAGASLSQAIPASAWPRLARAVQSGLERSGASRADLARAFERLDSKWSSSFRFDAADPHAPLDRRLNHGGLLDIAAAHGALDEIEFWCAAAGPDWNPDGGTAPLSWAIYGNRLDAAKLLLARGANPNGQEPPSDAPEQGAFDARRDSPLQVALLEPADEIAFELLRAGARATGSDERSLAELREKTSDAKIQEVVDSVAAMVRSDDPATAARGAGAMIALAASKWTTDDDFAGLGAALASAKARFDDGFSKALRAEAEHSAHVEVVFSAAIQARGQSREYQGSALDCAVAMGDLATARFIAEAAGGDWNPDGDDRPIDWAASVGDAKAIEILAKAGSGVERALPEGGAEDRASARAAAEASPLARAVAGGWREAAKTLLDLGADPMALPEPLRIDAKTLVGEADLRRVESRAVASTQSADAQESYFGLRQIINLARAEWIDNWGPIERALETMPVASHLAISPSGNTRAGDALSRERLGETKRPPLDSALGGEASFFAWSAAIDDVQATRLFARILGPDFRQPGDNGSPLANAVAMGRSAAASLLVSMGAKIDGEPSLLEIAAQRGDDAMFIMLAGAGAKPDRLTEAARAKIAPRLASKPNQQALASLFMTLPPDEDGFDGFLSDGSIAPALMANLARAGQRERFWNNRNRVDWSRDISSLVEASADGDPGLAAYAKFRRAVAADDVGAAADIVSGSPTLLASLAKRGLVDETILSSLGAGRSHLMGAMVAAHWPMESMMKDHAAEALLQAALGKDLKMFEFLLPMAPMGDSLPAAEQDAIARAAWRLGGPELLSRLDAQIGGLSPEAIGMIGDLFHGREGERAFCKIVVGGVEREADRSRSTTTQQDRIARRKAWFGLACSHWSAFDDAQKMDVAVSATRWNEPGFWERAEKTIATPASAESTSLDGPEAFYGFCFGDHKVAKALFARANEETAKPMGQAAQMAAAWLDDADLALAASGDIGCPSTEASILQAARFGHAHALGALLPRVEGATLHGLLSRALIPQSQRERSEMLHRPESGLHTLPEWACRELAENGATFDPKDTDPAQSQWLPTLAAKALEGKTSVDLERAFSTLALRGSLPEACWMPKHTILTRQPSLLEHASPADLNDVGLIERVVAIDGLALRHAGPIPRATLSTLKIACAQNADAFHSIPRSLATELGLTASNCAQKLAAAVDDAQSINPFKILARKAVNAAERKALALAEENIATSARARALNFIPLERAIVDAKLGEAERLKAQTILARARQTRKAFEHAGRGSDADMAELRRLVEINLPDLVKRYAATDPSSRNAWDDSTRSTPNKTLDKAFADAMVSIQGISGRVDDGARMGLHGEALVLDDKAQTSAILQRQRKLDAAAAQAEVEAEERAIAAGLQASEAAIPAAKGEALETFATTVEAAQSAATEPTMDQSPDAHIVRRRTGSTGPG